MSSTFDDQFQRGSHRVIWFILAVETLVSSAYILYFCRTFYISPLLLLIHIPLAIGVFFASFFLPGLVLLSRRLRNWEATKYWLAIIPGSVFAMVAVLYAADYVSYRWTGSNLNYKLIRLYLYDLRHGGELIQLSYSVYLSVAIFAFVVLGLHFALSRKVKAAAENLLLPGRPNSLFRDRRRAGKSIVILVVLTVGYAVNACVLLRRAPYSELLSSDPLISLARSTTEVLDPDYPAFADRIKREEKRCRDEYPRQQFEKKNVVLIVVDALRADHTQVYGYHRTTTPFLQSLFDAGHVRKVELATSACPATFCGVMSTLASKPYKWLMAEDFKLYDLLHDQGYKTYFLLSGGQTSLRLTEALGKEMDFYFDDGNAPGYVSTDDRLIFEGLARVPNYESSPAFFYFHVMAPHVMGVKDESFNAFQPVATRHDLRAMFRGESTQWPAIINTYDNAVMQADATIKQIFAELDRKQYLRNSVVVILSDHGEGLGERSKYGWGHGHWLYQESIRIPLLIYDESRTKYGNLEFATQMDVAPTVVERLGLKTPPCWHGKSLLDSNVRSFTTHQTESAKPCYAILERTNSLYKYIYCSVGKTEELYELRSDPQERNNLIEVADAALVQRMRNQLGAVLQR